MNMIALEVYFSGTGAMLVWNLGLGSRDERLLVVCQGIMIWVLEEAFRLV